MGRVATKSDFRCMSDILLDSSAIRDLQQERLIGINMLLKLFTGGTCSLPCGVASKWTLLKLSITHCIGETHGP